MSMHPQPIGPVAEGLSDRREAQAVRTRLGWKYALGLELTDPGFDFSVLSELLRWPRAPDRRDELKS